MSGYLQKKVILLLLLNSVTSFMIAQNPSNSTRHRRATSRKSGSSNSGAGDGGCGITEIGGFSIQAGDFVFQAVEMFENLAAIYTAKALITVTNYLNQPLTQCTAARHRGLTHSTVPMTVHSGTEEAFAVRQNKPGRGLEMTWSCRVRDLSGQPYRLLVYFKIGQKSAFRDASRLGVANEIDNGNWPRRSKDFTGWHKNLPVQCAANEFAIQATMTSSHTGEVDIKVYPNLIENSVNYSSDISETVRETRQKYLNYILDYPSSCRQWTKLL